MPWGGEFASERKQGLRRWLNARVKSPSPFRSGTFVIQGLYQLGNLDLKIISTRLQTLPGIAVQLLSMHQILARRKQRILYRLQGFVRPTMLFGQFAQLSVLLFNSP